MYLEVKYDTKAENVFVENRVIYIQLENKLELSFPADNNKRLAKATDSQLSNVEFICDGTGLHWEELDEDLSISGILDGRFG